MKPSLPVGAWVALGGGGLFLAALSTGAGVWWWHRHRPVPMTLPVQWNDQQQAMARIIVAQFRAAGLSDALIAAALVNAYTESLLDPSAIGDGGKSVGLFQLHEAGAGVGMSTPERQDPQRNTARILEVVRSPDGHGLRQHARDGATVAELTALFSRDIERPAREQYNMIRRMQRARSWWGILADVPGDRIRLTG